MFLMYGMPKRHTTIQRRLKPAATRFPPAADGKASLPAAGMATKDNYIVKTGCACFASLAMTQNNIPAFAGMTIYDAENVKIQDLTP